MKWEQIEINGRPMHYARHYEYTCYVRKQKGYLNTETDCYVWSVYKRGSLVEEWFDPHKHKAIAECEKTINEVKRNPKAWSRTPLTEIVGA